MTIRYMDQYLNFRSYEHSRVSITNTMVMVTEFLQISLWLLHRKYFNHESLESEYLVCI